MTEPDEPMTAAETLVIHRLCQMSNPIPGPIAWLCRYAWIAYTTLGADTDIEIEDVIARQAGWLNEPKHAETRRNLIGCIDFIQRMAAKPPLWQLPDNPMTLFAVDEFYPRWTLHGPGRFEIPDDLTLTVTCPHWAPADDRAEPPQRQPAKWDGRPFPGKCDVDDCDNQATNTVGYWDGGAPGAGTWHQHGRCPNHDPTMEFTPTGLDEFNPDTTWNPEIPR
ncbi:hypothetical protein I5J35_gp82 [Mycobacterium phage Rem711]|uniref:Uncharacterized protein n=1 Tax=Mycobacterium phage Rem711 TaxID=2079285 RepID=A0A2K9VF22_9CAUD|nr:hypothetical protein I5J35_gp82 [Mycobacterium phage Rem711]AUV60860.1 hypothetical protein SEA_REM711_82 [Mycobacterium phage Rem711]